MGKKKETSQSRIDAPQAFFFEFVLDYPGSEKRKIEDGSLKAFSINFLWLYFFHETLVAIRHQQKPWAIYVDPKDCVPVTNEHISKTLEDYTQDYIDLISEDYGGDANRVVRYVELADMSSEGFKAISDELVEVVTQSLLAAPDNSDNSETTVAP